MHNSVWINPIVVKVRTLKALIVPNEKDHEGSNTLNGAGGGICLGFPPRSESFTFATSLQ